MLTPKRSVTRSDPAGIGQVRGLSISTSTGIIQIGFVMQWPFALSAFMRMACGIARSAASICSGSKAIGSCFAVVGARDVLRPRPTICRVRTPGLWWKRRHSDRETWKNSKSISFVERSG